MRIRMLIGVIRAEPQMPTGEIRQTAKSTGENKAVGIHALEDEAEVAGEVVVVVAITGTIPGTVRRPPPGGVDLLPRSLRGGSKA